MVATWEIYFSNKLYENFMWIKIFKKVTNLYCIKSFLIAIFGQHIKYCVIQEYILWKKIKKGEKWKVSLIDKYKKKYNDYDINVDHKLGV